MRKHIQKGVKNPENYLTGIRFQFFYGVDNPDDFLIALVGPGVSFCHVYLTIAEKMGGPFVLAMSNVLSTIIDITKHGLEGYL